MGSALSLMHEKWLVLQHSVFGLWSNSQTDEELMEAEQQRQNEKFELMTKVSRSELWHRLIELVNEKMAGFVD